MAIGQSTKPCTVILHDNAVSKDDVLCGTNVLPTGSVAYLVAPSTKALCICSQAAAKNPDEVSVHISVAKRFRFENRMKASVHPVEYAEEATATHVEVLFRDQHLSRADMWRMKAQVDSSVLYQGQKLNYLGSNAATVENIYIAGQEVESAYVSNPQTKLIFRSGSARFTVLIQISREMLEYWKDGDLMYERLIAGFLPDLFRRWEELKTRHTVTVVIFGRRVLSEMTPSVHNDDLKSNAEQRCKFEDFFRVIVSNMPSGDWHVLLRRLKKAFNTITSSQQTCLATEGNMLQAIHLAAMDFADSRIDPAFASTGIAIIAITAGAGLFKAEYDLLFKTTKLLMGTSIGVDIVSLSPKPLHPVPLFQYELESRREYSLPHWADISYWTSPSEHFYSQWLLPGCPGGVIDISVPPLQVNVPADAKVSTAKALDKFDDNVFSAVSEDQDNASKFAAAEDRSAKIISADTVDRPSTGLKIPVLTHLEGTVDAEIPSVNGLPTDSVVTDKEFKKDARPPHLLMHTGRKISVGPRGLNLSQGAASTTLSVQNAEQAREGITTVSTVGKDDTSNVLASQIRATLRRKPSQRSIASRPTLATMSTSKPIDISTKEESKGEDVRDPASAIEKAVMAQSKGTAEGSDGSLSATPRASQGSYTISGFGTIAFQDDTTSPWLTLLNPCNPRRDNMRVASEYRQWQNIFPRTISSGAFKWGSMCTPAILPLMTENRISLADLDKHFNKKVRRLLTSQDGAHRAMRQMISLRLAAGFQMVPMRKLPHAQMPSGQIDRMLLWLGGNYHELRCLSEIEIQVSEYGRVSDSKYPESTSNSSSQYAVRVKSLAAQKERPTRVQFGDSERVMEWSSLDDQAVNTNTLIDELGTSCARFVLIPVDIPRTDTQTSSHARELSDEERRLDGINRLTQLWQRNRYFTDEDERHRISMNKPKTSGTVDRDPNPLAIEYQTRDPSAVVSAYGTTLAEQLAKGETTAPLFPESELYHSSNFDMTKLVKQMQEPPPTGVELRDRRWFTRLHLKCFRGDEMTNWLLRVFKDLQTRDDAIALGNQLMAKDIFTHVRGKHEFRDGNYFYQIKSAHRTTDYPDTAGFFAKGIGRSVPSTPITEMKQSPSVRAAQVELDASSKSSSTPTLAPLDKREKNEVMLSQMLPYNVDPAKKSAELEVVNLHYDRIHNPENCYHIQLDWTSTTPKLIRESITRWTSLVDGHGLKLVQLPLAEANKVHDQHPFDQPIPVRLSMRPPNKTLSTPHLDPHSFSPRLAEDPDGYHKALLRRMDFVLDFEAANSFPRRIDVSYSWGRPNYEYTQFVHKSGLLLAQIANNSNSDFVLLRNRLATQTLSSPAKKDEPTSLESLVLKLTAFCRDDAALKKVFDEVKKTKFSAPSPLSNAALDADSEIPPMELPPHLAHQAQNLVGTTKIL